MHWSAQDAARTLVSRILLRKPEDMAQRSLLRVEGSSQTATEKLGDQPPGRKPVVSSRDPRS